MPDGAVVATDTGFRCEYLLFGDRLSRYIIPLRSFTGERYALPHAAQYLLYSPDSKYARRGDIELCTQLYLKQNNRLVPLKEYGPLYVRKLK